MFFFFQLLLWFSTEAASKSLNDDIKVVYGVSGSLTLPYLEKNDYELLSKLSTIQSRIARMDMSVGDISFSPELTHIRMMSTEDSDDFSSFRRVMRRWTINDVAKIGNSLKNNVERLYDLKMIWQCTLDILKIRQYDGDKSWNKHYFYISDLANVDKKTDIYNNLQIAKHIKLFKRVLSLPNEYFQTDSFKATLEMLNHEFELGNPHQMLNCDTIKESAVRQRMEAKYHLYFKVKNSPKESAEGAFSIFLNDQWFRHFVERYFQYRNMGIVSSDDQKKFMDALEWMNKLVYQSIDDLVTVAARDYTPKLLFSEDDRKFMKQPFPLLLGSSTLKPGSGDRWAHKKHSSLVYYNGTLALEKDFQYLITQPAFCKKLQTWVKKSGKKLTAAYLSGNTVLACSQISRWRMWIHLMREKANQVLLRMKKFIQ